MTGRIKTVSDRYFLPPLLLLICLLLVNGCTRKTPAPEESGEPASEIETIRSLSETALEDEQTEQEEEETEVERPEKVEKKKKRKLREKTTDRERKKLPATQRPYVIEGQTYYPIPSAEGYEETGTASWYGDPFHGRKTANGETYNMYSETAAHKTLPMDTMLLVKNLVNGKTATVRINDRGPFVDGRIIDLSYTTAKRLGLVRTGTGEVQIIALCAAEDDDSDQEDAVVPEEENDRKDVEEEGGIPVLVAQGKKKRVGKMKAKGSDQAPGAMCSVIRFDGKKLRIIRQNFDKGSFYIQVGSFEKRENARKLARTFADKGRDVVIQEFAAAGSSLFRVLVFSSTSLKEAKRHKEKLVQQGYEHAFVVARDDSPKKRANRKEKKGSGKVAKN